MRQARPGRKGRPPRAAAPKAREGARAGRRGKGWACARLRRCAHAAALQRQRATTGPRGPDVAALRPCAGLRAAGVHRLPQRAGRRSSATTAPARWPAGATR